MLKFLLFSLVLTFSFDAEALVKQSASKALVYQNVVESSSSAKNSSAPKTYQGGLRFKKTASNNEKNNDTTDQPTIKKVDMKNTMSSTVSLKVNDEVEISLTEEDGFSWDLNPSSSGVDLVANVLVDDLRVITYKMKSTSHVFVYFDYLDNQKNVVTTKQLTINPQ